MSLYKQYKTDRSREEDGVAVEFDEGVIVTIRRANCKLSKEVRERLSKPYVSAMRTKSIPEKIQEDIDIKHIAEGIIATWEGVCDEKGKELEPTLENKIKVLTELPDFREEVVSLSIKNDLFKAELNEESVKN